MTTKDVTRNYEAVKTMLFLKAMAEKDVPSGVPFKIIAGDMAVTCGIQFGQSENAFSCATVTESMLKLLGVTWEQLFKDAKENAPKNRPAVFSNMGSVLSEIAGDDVPVGETGLMVAGVKGNLFGAAVICYPGFLKGISEKLGSFYILPSSVHEVLILPDDGEPKAMELNMMIKAINEAEVLPQDRLSDIAYHFDGTHLETAQAYESRR